MTEAAANKAKHQHAKTISPGEGGGDLAATKDDFQPLLDYDGIVEAVRRAVHQSTSADGVSDAAAGGDVGKTIGDDQPLMSAGLTSSGAVAVHAALEAGFGLTLPGTLVFDYPTLSDIAGYIDEVFRHKQQQRRQQEQEQQQQRHKKQRQRRIPATGANPLDPKEGGAAVWQSDFASESASKVVEAVDAAVRDALNLHGDAHLPGDDEPLMSAGLTSLGAVRLQENLGAAVGSALRHPLPATLAFDYPNLGSLRSYVLSSLVITPAVPENDSAMFDKNVTRAPPPPRTLTKGPLNHWTNEPMDHWTKCARPGLDPTMSCSSSTMTLDSRSSRSLDRRRRSGDAIAGGGGGRRRGRRQSRNVVGNARRRWI